MGRRLLLVNYLHADDSFERKVAAEHGAHLDIFRPVGGKPSEVPAAVAEQAEGLISYSAVQKIALPPEAFPKVRCVLRSGVGYDTIDVPACTARGVMLSIAPDGVRRPVATNVITFVLCLAQKLFLKDRLTREGRWAEKTSHMGMGLTGRTLGLVGVGNIGAEVFRLAMPFEMKHIAYDPMVRPEQLRGLNVELVGSLDEVMRRSDFVSVNCPLSASTRGLIGAREIALMKPTAYIINTARGPIIQERALHEALAAGRIAGAGLDVFEVEPTPRDNPILALDNVIVTPHGLCFTDECFTGIARNTFEAVRALADGAAPKYVVNREALKHPALSHLRT